MDPQTTGDLLRNLLTAAWLLPLLGFIAEIYWLRWSHRLSKSSALCAVACIGLGFLCSFSALMVWGNATGWAALSPVEHHGSSEHHGSEASHPEHAPADAAAVIAGAGQENHGEEVVHSAKSVQKAFSGTFYQLAKFGSLKLSLDWYIDSLTLVMFTMVTFIATCIHIFAIGYMKDELTEEYEDHEVHTSHGHFTRPGRFHRFFAYLSLFCFSMLGLVLAGNIFQVFIFWELVGVCSYLLIGFYIERKSASTAANKAFIMNRVGDFGFLIGLMILWTWCGTFQFADSPTSGDAGLFTMVRGNDGKLDVSEDGKEVFLRDASGHRLQQHGQDRSIGYLLLIAAGCGIFAGCIGKSAQFPLQTWLPDAMEGPTPVSALIHAATMVTAGVYLIARTHVLFELSPFALEMVGWVGAITALLASFTALTQTDIKRVLAYSTMSQIGYMFLALGVGAYQPAIFHLMTHAFFKALLFLSAGSVILALHHEQDIFKMGGLRKQLPFVYAVFLIGSLALVAFPGTSGFFSKDEILWQAYASGHTELWALGLFGAFLTATYTFRLIFIAFFGESHAHKVHVPHGIAHTLPLAVLAVFAVLGGFIHQPLDSVLPVMNIPEAIAHQQHSIEALSVAVSLAGIALAWLLFLKSPAVPAALKSSALGAPLHTLWSNAWGFDWLYDLLFKRPYLWFVRVNARDGIDVAIAYIPMFFQYLHRLSIQTQTGRLRWYAASMAAGAVLLIAGVLLA